MNMPCVDKSITGRVYLYLLMFVGSFCLTACSNDHDTPSASPSYKQNTQEKTAADESDSLVGDKDAFSCMTLEGHQWCASIKRCERPEALAEAYNLSNTPEAISTFCNAVTGMKDPTPRVGNDRDENGCITSAGYQWCEKLKECVRPWELAHQADFENTREAFEAYCNNK